MSRIAYYRVSSKDQTIASQRAALSNGKDFDQEFSDEGVSGAIIAAKRPGFAKMLDYVRKGDTLFVYAVDRLGRDAIDVQTTVRDLLAKGVTLEIHGVGQLADTPVGRMMIALMAQMAEIERQRIIDRTAAGREVAKAALASTGKTHKGKTSLGGRPAKTNPADVKEWRIKHGKSLAETAEHFKLSVSTVKRHCGKQTQEAV